MAVENHYIIREITLDASGVFQSAVERHILASGITVQTWGSGDCLTQDHDKLLRLGVDSHTIYPLADGTRGFTAAVSGILPTASGHLTTKDYVDSNAGGGTPGTWTQLAKGPTTLDQDTTATLATISSIADGEVLVPYMSGREDSNMNVYSGDSDSPPGSDECVFSVDKTTTADQHLFKAVSGIFGSKTFDWVIYKVVPE